MRNKLPYFFPFIYFVKSRVPSLRHFSFHIYNEWMPAFFFLYVTSHSFTFALQNFLIYYLIFISFYELGYLLNDHYSVKHEDVPRLRSVPLTAADLFFVILIRIALFVFLVWYTGIWADREFIIFYSILGVVFLAHNIITKNEYKIFTFITLATLRYIAPFGFLIPNDLLMLIFPSIILNYVIYRSYTYLESKSLLIIPGRKNANFKLGYYSALIPLSVLISFLFKDSLPFYINLYYLFFWIVFWIMEGRMKRK